MDKLVIDIENLAAVATVIALICFFGIYVSFAEQVQADEWDWVKAGALIVAFLLSSTIVLMAFLVIWTLR